MGDFSESEVSMEWLNKFGGSWTITWKNGKSTKYTITSEGELSVDGINQVFQLKPSENKVFPASEGWLTWFYMGRTYYIQIVNGLMYLHHFGGVECKSIYKSLSGYCGSGEGKTVTGSLLFHKPLKSRIFFESHK